MALIQLSDVTFAYDGSYDDVFTGLTCQLDTTWRLGLIGRNGRGKTTLLRLMTGELKPRGSVRMPVHPAMFPFPVEDAQQSALDVMLHCAPDAPQWRLMVELQSLGMEETLLARPYQTLSRGEQTKVQLAALFAREDTYPLIDEPTNHLDLASKEILEDVINSYTGTVLYVSHDRYFINKMATRILDLAGKKLLNYIGNYDYYLEKRLDVEAACLGKPLNEKSAESRGLPWASAKSQYASDGEQTSSRLSWQKQKEEQARIRKIKNDLKKTEDEIHALETRNEEIDSLLTQEEIYTNPDKLLELHNEKSQIEKRLEELLEKWEQLAAEEQGL